MAQFVFLYRRGEEGPRSPAQMQQRMQRWQAWFQELAQKGHLQDRGLPLELTGTVVAAGAKRNITDGPFAEKDLVMGFSLINAADLQQASEISLGCPILEDGGGRVEVRPVMAM
jgi:hypothetical protein